MNLQSITLVFFGNFDSVFIEKIAANIHEKFLVEVTIKEGHLDLSDFYDAARLQYNANMILEQINLNFATDNSKTIGLFNVDLFIPIFTYIFGQAYLNGQTGIASCFRLYNERYGIESDENIVLERFCKGIIHELGHTFGLVHCFIPDCVMRAGTYVEDIDQKGNGFCPTCISKLKSY